MSVRKFSTDTQTYLSNAQIQFIIKSVLGFGISIYILAGCGSGDATVNLQEGGTEAYMPPTGTAGTNMAGTNAGEMEETAGTMAGTTAGTMAGTTAGTMAGTTAGTMAGTTAGTMGMQVCETFPLNVEEFNAEIAPDLISKCGNCHGPTGTIYQLPYSSNLEYTPPLMGDAAELAFNNSLEYLDADNPNPEASELFTRTHDGHGGGIYYEVGGEQYNRLKEWIENVEQCEIVYPDPAGEMAGEMAGIPNPEDNQFACNLLRNGDPLNRNNGQYYQEFVDDINVILTRGCGDSGCHDLPEYGFWIQKDSLCAVESNFLTAQLHITPSNVEESPLLARGFEPDHSGYGLFANGGMSDPAFIKLRNWVVSGL